MSAEQSHSSTLNIPASTAWDELPSSCPYIPGVYLSAPTSAAILVYLTLILKRAPGRSFPNEPKPSNILPFPSE